MAIAIGDTIDTKTLAPFNLVDVNSDPCIRCDGLVSVNSGTGDKEWVYTGDTIDGKFSQDFPATTSGAFLKLNTEGTSSFVIGDPDAGDETVLVLTLTKLGTGGQYESGSVFLECNPFVIVYGAMRRTIIPGMFYSQYLFPGRTPAGVIEEGASTDSIYDGDTKFAGSETYTALGGANPAVKILIRDHSDPGLASGFVSAMNAGTACTFVFEFPKGVDSCKPCGRDRLAGTAGRLRTRR